MVVLRDVPKDISALLDNFWKYCDISTPNATLVTPSKTNAGSPFTSTYIPLQVGTLVPLSVSVPTPGDPSWLPSNINIFPTSTVLDYRWHIRVASFDRGLSPTFGSVDAKPGTSFNDVSGAFQILKGDLTSPSLTIIPWPDSTLQGAASPTLRGFQISLTIGVWTPLSGRLEYNFPKDKTGVDQVFQFGVDSWASTLFGITDKTTRPGQVLGSSTLTPSQLQNNGIPDPLVFLRDMFNVSIDTLAPAPGQAATFVVVPKDRTKQVPQKVRETVSQNPAYKVSAAIEAGVVLENVVSAVSSVFGVNKNLHKPANGAIGVPDLLRDALALPLAVDITGTSSSRTLQPTTDALVPVIDKTADVSGISGVTGGPALGGTVPIGQLTAKVTAVTKDMIFNVTGNPILSATLNNSVFGGTLLPIPQLVPFPDPTVTPGPNQPPKSSRVEIVLPVYLTVPGLDTPYKLLFSLGTVEIKTPQIPVPQVTLLRRVLGANLDTDLRLSLDPVARLYMPTADAVKSALENLGSTLKPVLNAFNGTESPDALALLQSASSLAAALNQMYAWFAGVPSLATKIGPLAPVWRNFLADSLAPDWFSTDNHDLKPLESNVSGIAWIGCPNTTLYPAQWRMGLLLYRSDGSVYSGNDQQNVADTGLPTDFLMFPSYNRAALQATAWGVVLQNDPLTADSRTYPVWYPVANGLITGSSVAWNDRAVSVSYYQPAPGQ